MFPEETKRKSKVTNDKIELIKEEIKERNDKNNYKKYTRELHSLAIFRKRSLRIFLASVTTLVGVVVSPNNIPEINSFLQASPFLTMPIIALASVGTAAPIYLIQIFNLERISNNYNEELTSSRKNYQNIKKKNIRNLKSITKSLDYDIEIGESIIEGKREELQLWKAARGVLQEEAYPNLDPTEQAIANLYAPAPVKNKQRSRKKLTNSS